MTGTSVVLYVGATTLTAAIVTLGMFRITAIRMDRRRNLRSRPLEGPDPDCRSLSWIGVNTQAARAAYALPSQQGQQPIATAGASTDNDQRPQSKAPVTSPSQQQGQEARLNSLQTIKARSAALQSDARQAKPVSPKPLMSLFAQAAQAPGTPPVLPQDQGTPPSRAKASHEQKEKAEPSPASADDSTQQTPPRTSSSKRSKRAGAPAQPIENHASSIQDMPTSAAADSDEQAGLPSIPAGVPAAQGDNILDLFAGLNEPDAGISDVIDDLSGIDGGGLPTPTPTATAKSKR